VLLVKIISAQEEAMPNDFYLLDFPIDDSKFIKGGFSLVYNAMYNGEAVVVKRLMVNAQRPGDEEGNAAHVRKVCIFIIVSSL
jgi:hypothetical protein